jgi:hypothetical protein
VRTVELGQCLTVIPTANEILCAEIKRENSDSFNKEFDCFFNGVAANRIQFFEYFLKESTWAFVLFQLWTSCWLLDIAPNLQSKAKKSRFVLID